MGICPANQEVPEGEEEEPVIVEKPKIKYPTKFYGDWFTPDSRAVYAILKHAEVDDFTFQHVDSLKLENT